MKVVSLETKVGAAMEMALDKASAMVSVKTRLDAAEDHIRAIAQSKGRNGNDSDEEERRVPPARRGSVAQSQSLSVKHRPGIL